MTFDGKSLYVAGIHETDGEIEWVIYSILIKPKDQIEILLDWLVIIIGIITLVAILILIFFLFKRQQDIRMLK
jgi:heme/copper-type cytochrome/quinol oxidase subunit 2